MTAATVARALSSAAFIYLLWALWPATRNVMRSDSVAKPHELVMSGVWLLALNRMTFAGVSQFARTDDVALSVCYAFALFGGLYMIFMCSLAKHRG